MEKINDLLKCITEVAPLSLQESYDNSGLLIGDPEAMINSVLLSIDITEEVIEEAIEKKCGLIISHHPLIFHGLKQITPKGPIERCITKAIKHDVAIAAMHTNLDNYSLGVNAEMARRLSLSHTEILQPLEGTLRKLVVFCPVAQANQVREAIFNAGGGNIGNYDSCSFNQNGTGTFRGNELTKPFAGQKGVLHEENELKIETVVPLQNMPKVVSAMLNAHPYEEVAYDIYKLDNKYFGTGAGMVGFLEEPIDELEFMRKVQAVFGSQVLRHSLLLNKKIQKVALCGGSGAFLVHRAKAVNADVFLTADIKYHDFFEADNKILLIDAGHFETEQFTKELIADLIRKKFPTFAVLKTEVNTNAVQYHFNK